MNQGSSRPCCLYQGFACYKYFCFGLMGFVPVDLTFFLFLWQTGLWAVVRYFLPDSVNVREMTEASPLNSDRELINFIHSVQLCVEAYHDRKYQITRAKVM